MSRPITKVYGTLLLGDDPLSVTRAGNIIKNGGLVAFPTETVYGLGAAATDSEAVKRIFTAKGRPLDNPLIVHISSREQLNQIAKTVPDTANILIDKFWPGPLSLVLHRSEAVPAIVSAGLSTVAVRMPNHRVALDLIAASGVPIAAPSANRSGRPSPTTYNHVLEDLAGRIDAVIRSTICPIGVESTVLDLTGLKPVMLRPGGLTREELEETLGCRLEISGLKYSGSAPHSPGMKYRHYSPRAPLILVTGPINRRRRLIKMIFNYYRRKGLRVGYLDPVTPEDLMTETGSEQLARNLYSNLRRMDALEMDLILAEETEPAGLGLAVMNRIRKAAVRVLNIK